MVAKNLVWAIVVLTGRTKRTRQTVQRADRSVKSDQWRAEGGADGAMAPAIHPGASKGPVFVKM